MLRSVAHFSAVVAAPGVRCIQGATARYGGVFRYASRMRHALLTTDESKPNLRSYGNRRILQASLQKCAASIAALEKWKIVSCLMDDKLRSKDNINTELYGLIRPLL